MSLKYDEKVFYKNFKCSLGSIFNPLSLRIFTKHGNTKIIKKLKLDEKIFDNEFFSKIYLLEITNEAFRKEMQMLINEPFIIENAKL